MSKEFHEDTPHDRLAQFARNFFRHTSEDEVLDSGGYSQVGRRTFSNPEDERFLYEFRQVYGNTAAEKFSSRQIKEIGSDTISQGMDIFVYKTENEDELGMRIDVERDNYQATLWIGDGGSGGMLDDLQLHHRNGDTTEFMRDPENVYVFICLGYGEGDQGEEKRMTTLPYFEMPGINKQLQDDLVTKQIDIAGTWAELSKNFTLPQPRPLGECIKFN